MTWLLSVRMVLLCKRLANVLSVMMFGRSTIPPEPVVEARYAGELNPETKAKIAELKKTDPKAAQELYQSVSYHVDHGNGLDCYKVGPTLGGGTAALMPDGEIVYPYCYATQDILDNGPLRFTVKLVYNPLTIKGDSTVIENTCYHAGCRLSLEQDCGFF